MRPLLILLAVAAFTVTSSAEQYFLTVRYVTWTPSATTQPSAEIKRTFWGGELPPADATEGARYVLNIRTGYPFELQVVDGELELQLDGILAGRGSGPELAIRVKRKSPGEKHPSSFQTRISLTEREETYLGLGGGPRRLRRHVADQQEAWLVRLDPDPRAPATRPSR